MTTIAVAVPLTAVLCTAISSVISTLVTVLVMCYCIINKKKGIDEEDKSIPPEKDPVYDTPQVFGESSADIELKENTCYASKSDA